MQANSQLNSINDSNIRFYHRLTQSFNDYFIGLFNQFSQLINKTIQKQQHKIQNNQHKLTQLFKIISSKSTLSLTSLSQIDINSRKQYSNNSTKQNQSKQNLSKQNIKHLKIQSICQITKNTDLINIQQVNQAINKLQSGISYLQSSLNQLQSIKYINYPEPLFNIHTLSNLLSKISSNTTTQTYTLNKIRKFNHKINQFAKQTSIQEIQTQSKLLNKFKISKSKSLINLSNRKFHPFSCPKKYQYGSILLKKNYSQSQLNIPTQLNIPSQEQFTISGIKSEVNLPQTSIISQNKMPLINKSKSILNQLLNFVKDQADANVVKFHLKKTFKYLQQMFHKRQVLQNNQYSNRIEDRRNAIGNESDQVYSKKELIPEYFANKIKTLQNHSLHNNHNACENKKSRCSIVNMLPINDGNVSWVKQNYSQINNQHSRLNQNNMNNQNNIIRDKQSQNTNNSRQKRKYFQRTSNQQKITILKSKLKTIGNKY